jgi:hypothetical protein
MIAHGGPQQWLNFIRRSSSKKDKRIKLGIVLTFWWQIWKERNHRIFEGKEMSANSLAMLTREELNLYSSVFYRLNA